MTVVSRPSTKSLKTWCRDLYSRGKFQRLHLRRRSVVGEVSTEPGSRRP